MHENDHIQTRTGKTPGKRHRHSSKHIETSLDIDEGDIEQIGSYMVSLHGPNPRVAHCNTTCTYWRDKTLSTKVEHCVNGAGKEDVWSADDAVNLTSQPAGGEKPVWE